MANILRQNINIDPSQRTVITDILQRLGNEFTKRGEIDYESMIDELKKTAINNSELNQTVGILVKEIKSRHPYYHVSRTCELIYMKIEKEIKGGSYDDACADLKILYEQHVQEEKALNGIGLAGFIFTTISLAIPVIENIIEFILSLAK